MKFQCDSCGAKYKIADEKVAGRDNVRFSCRRCSHKILLSDPSLNGLTSSTSYVVSTARQPDKSDDFMTAKRPGVQVSGAPKSATEEPIWHVSINDVPIGPIKREELAHKIDSGAVSEYSLVWNSSFDEWRPLATVPELMSLIHNRRGSQPPLTSRFSSAPPEASTRVAQVGEVLRASAVSQPTMVAAPGLSDPFGQAVQPSAPAKPRRKAERVADFFGGHTVDTSLADGFDPPTVSSLLDDQPTVSSMLDDQPTVSSMLDESLDQPTVNTALGEELTMGSMLGEELTVSSMLDDQPTTNSMLDEAAIMNSLVEDPFAPGSVGARRPSQLQNPLPPGIPLSRHDGSGSFSAVLTASSFSPEAPDSSVAAPQMAVPATDQQSRPAQDRRSVTAPHPIGQYPRAGSVAVPTQNAYPSVPRAPQPVTTQRNGMSPWAWAMVASFAVFAGVLAVLVFDKFVKEDQLGLFTFDFASAEEPELPAETEITETEITEMEIVETEISEPALVAEPTAQEPPALFDPNAEGLAANSVQLSAEATDMEFALDEDGADEPAEDEPAEDEPDEAETKSPSKSKARSRAKARTPTKSSEAAPSEDSGIRRLAPQNEDAKLLAQFEQSGAGAPAKIKVAEAPSTQAQREPLEAKDLTAVVNKNKPRLQRCYERAIRGQQEPPAVRLDVSVKVAVSGRVTSAKAAGRGPGGLTECVESLVRRWRFPVSSEAVETRFPVVFAAN